MYTNKGLVKHAEKALNDKTRYMWGGIYRPITENYIQQLYKIYGTKRYSAERINKLREYIGKDFYGIDCVGLVKSYYWSGKADGGTGSPKYGAAGFPDVNANAMFAAAKVKGSIDTLPEVPGIVLYSKTHPHVGVYVGNGDVIESTLSIRGDGVSKTKVKNWSGWTHWFECPYITYEKAETVLKTKTYTLPFPAVVRAKPATNSARLTRYPAGRKVDIIENETKLDEATGILYVKIISGNREAWIAKSTLGG